MSAAMSFQEFGNLLKYIANNNSPINHTIRGTPTVKYVDPHMDMRTNTVFSVKLRGFGSEAEFYVMNEARDIPESLYDRIMTYLITPIH
jgi:hypothetical protein